MFNYAFPATLKKLIIEQETKPAYISRKTGISQVIISQYIHDKHTPSAYNVLVLADFFGVTTDYLLTGQEDKRAWKS